MSFDEALGHSFERLQLMLREKKRLRARDILDLGQLIAMGTNGSADAWNAKQNELLEQIHDD